MGLARPEKGRDSVRDLNRQPAQPADGRIGMAKSGAREYVWLQCTESGDLNYWAQVNTRGGISEGLRSGLMKYCPRLRKHTIHKIKRK
jgi:large subunit ribosomal protein L33